MTEAFVPGQSGRRYFCDRCGKQLGKRDPPCPPVTCSRCGHVNVLKEDDKVRA